MSHNKNSGAKQGRGLANVVILRTYKVCANVAYHEDIIMGDLRTEGLKIGVIGKATVLGKELLC